MTRCTILSPDFSVRDVRSLSPSSLSLYHCLLTVSYYIIKIIHKQVFVLHTSPYLVDSVYRLLENLLFIHKRVVHSPPLRSVLLSYTFQSFDMIKYLTSHFVVHKIKTIILSFPSTRPLLQSPQPSLSSTP